MPTRTLEYGVPGFVETLPASMRARLQGAAVAVRYRDRTIIQQRGDRSCGLSIVQAGAVRFGNVGADGMELTGAVLGVGQTFGEMTLFADLPRTFDAWASGPTTIGHVSRARFEAVLRRHPQLGRLFLRSLSMQLHTALEFIDDMRRLPLDVRVAKVLCVMANGRKGRVVLETTQGALGDTLGVTRVSVAKVLARLEDQGLIVRGYAEIEVPCAGVLRRWVGAAAKLRPVARP